MSLTPPTRKLTCGHEVRVEQLIHGRIILGSGAIFEMDICPICNPHVANTDIADPRGTFTIRTAK